MDMNQDGSSEMTIVNRRRAWNVARKASEYKGEWEVRPEMACSYADFKG